MTNPSFDDGEWQAQKRARKAVLLASPPCAWSFSALCCAAAAQGFQLLTKRMARDFEASLR